MQCIRNYRIWEISQWQLKNHFKKNWCWINLKRKWIPSIQVKILGHCDYNGGGRDNRTNWFGWMGEGYNAKDLKYSWGTVATRLRTEPWCTGRDRTNVSSRTLSVNFKENNQMDIGTTDLGRTTITLHARPMTLSLCWERKYPVRDL